jgi:hypothetical protein
MMVIHRLQVVVLWTFFLTVFLYGSRASFLESAQAAEAIEFSGTVLSIDVSAGKFAVKKDGGGSRFTFVVNQQTHFDGGPKTIKDLEKGERVTVLYHMQGSQYLAIHVTRTK